MSTRITGRYVKPDQTPDRGHVDFTLTPAAVQASGEQVTASTVRAELDAQGAIDLTIVPDEELVDVDGRALYRVRERVGGTERDWWLYVEDGTDLDLPARYPGDAYAPTAAVVPVPGPRGPQGQVAVDSTTTGPPGTDALVEDLDPADTAALLRFTIPRGDPGEVTEERLTEAVADGIAGHVAQPDPHDQYPLKEEAVPPSAIWVAGSEALSPLVNAYEPITGRLAIGGKEMGDTGNRNITALVINGWSATRLYVRRIGSTVRYWGYGIDATAATNDQVFDTVSGFNLFMWGVDGVVGNANGVLRVAKYGNGLSASAAVWASDRTVLDYMGTTNQSWPTSLPGTPA